MFNPVFLVLWSLTYKGTHLFTGFTVTSLLGIVSVWDLQREGVGLFPSYIAVSTNDGE